jgi:PAS domain S-box-containing protein
MQSGSIVAEIERLNWSLAAVTDITRVLVRAKSEHEVFVTACEAATRQGYYDIAWIGLPRQDVRRTVLVGASAGGERAHLEEFDISWGDVPLGRGPTGTAIRTGQLQICNNSAANPGQDSWHEWMRLHGIRSSLALPIKLPNGSVIASMTVYSRHENAFTAAEAELFRQLGDDIGFGIDMLRTRAAYGEALAYSEQQERRIHMLSAALQTSAEGVAIADRGGRIFSINPAFTRITGFEAADMAGQHPDSLVSGHAEERSLTAIWTAVEETGAWQGEIRCRRKQGGFFPAMLGLNAVRGGDGSTTHHVMTLLDLTRLKVAEEAARDERIFSESMMESTPGLIYFYDREGHFHRWNRNFSLVSGYSDAEIAGMTPLDFFHAEDRELLKRRIEEVFERGEAWVEAPFLTKSGRTIPYLFTGRRVEIQGHDYLVGVGIDITGDKAIPSLLSRSSSLQTDR